MDLVQLLIICAQLFGAAVVGRLVAEHAYYSWQNQGTQRKQLLRMSDPCLRKHLNC